MKKKLRAVLDTNILISGIIFKGKPRQVLEKVFEERLKAVTSRILLAELTEVLTKKFPLLREKTIIAEQEIEKVFEVVRPSIKVQVQEDDDDNRVLEAAVEGTCDFIVTWDRQLLNTKIYRGIKIVTASQFLDLIA